MNKPGKVVLHPTLLARASEDRDIILDRSDKEGLARI